MSTDEPREHAEPARHVRWPMSPVNTVLVAVCTIGAVLCLLLGETTAGMAILAGATAGAIGAVFARRGSSGDLERVNALEYADERDRAAAVKGLAAVGVLALVLAAAQLIMHVIVSSDALSRNVSLGVFLALMIVWFLANWYFVRRG